MKRKFTFLTAALALLAFLAIPMGMKGQTRAEVTWTASENGYTNGQSLDGVSIELDDYITIQFDKNDGNNPPAYYNTGTAARLYPKNSLTITPASGYQITGMTLTYSATGNTGTMGASVGSYSLSSATGTWSGSSTSAVVLTNNATSGHARMQVLTVTYSEEGSNPPTPTTYTVTYDCNGGTSGCPENVTGIEAGTNITLEDGPVKDGYDFSGWSDGTTIYDEGDEYTVNGNVTFTAQWTEVVSGDVQWVLTNLADLTANDVFVIVGNNGSNYAMTNNNGTGSAPATAAVTVENDVITSTVAANIQWTVSGDATNGYTFYPNGSTATWLYCNTTANSSSNNNMRVGTGARKVFEMNSNNYLMTKDNYVVRYLSIYDNADWRGYINTNLCPVMSFYKKVTGGVVPPSITAANVDIEYNATSGSISYTINNEVAGGTLTATTQSNWLTLGVVGTTVPFTCTANEAGTARTATVTLTYTYNRETVTKDVTVTQAAAPVVYNTMQAIFDKATEVGSTATSVNIALQNWVVSGVSTNGKNVFVTDGTKGFVIFDSNGDMGFAVGNVLSGTVSCKVQLYHGFAEITELNSSTEGISIVTGGTVTEANIAMDELAGVNTSALVSYDNLTCSVTTSGNNTFYNLSDGTTTIQVYNTLYAFGTLTDGKTYNITGIYQQYNSTKEILPRSAADIEEVVSAVASVTVTPNTINAPAEGADGSLALTYENITEFYSFDFYFCDAEGEELQDDPDWIYAEINEENDVYTLDYLIDANDGAARTAYMKVYTFDDDEEEVYAIVTVNQAEYVAPTYAELPFEFDGGKADIENTNGLYQEGLGTDYNGGNNATTPLKFDGTGDWLLLQFAERPGTLTFDITGNGFSGGTFTVQTSEDGTTYTDLQAYTELGATQNEEFTNLGENVRYIKWIYTNKSGGNVGLGNIALAEYEAPQPAITLNSYLIEATAEETEGSLTVTYTDILTNFDPNFDPRIYWYESDGVTPASEPDWMIAEINTQLNVDYMIEGNEGAARTAYFKLYGFDGDYNEVYSDLVTVSQAGAPQQYTLEVTSISNAEIFVFDATDPDENDWVYLFEGVGSEQVTEGTPIALSVAAEAGYTLTSLMVNNDEHVNDIQGGLYTFTMPASNVTITVTAVENVAPAGGNYVRIFSLNQLTDGSKVIIAARYDEEHTNGYFAMPGETSGKPTGVQFTSETSGNDEILPATITASEDTYYWTVNVTDNGYTFTNAEGQMIGYTSGTDFSNGNNAHKDWTITRETAENTAMVAEYTGFVIRNVNTNTRAFAFNGSKFGAYSTTTNLNGSGYNFFLDFFVQAEAVEPETYTLDITGYEAGSAGGYYLIASPVTVDPDDVTGMTDGAFDLYYFDEGEDQEWRNWKDNGEDGHFNLVPGKCYLYAKQATVPGEVFHFELTGIPYTGNGTIILHKTEGGDFPGWNLIGNPFGVATTIGRDFYVIQDTENGSELITSQSDEIAPMQGIFVVAAQDGDQVTFTVPVPGNVGEKIVVNVRNNRGDVIDRAMIRFGEGRQLPKFMLNPNNTKLYIAQDGEDFAVVRSINENSTPVSFRAAENGTYTLRVNAENIEMEYLHLIDNMTGTDVDLLATPSYSFAARTTDIADRFRLVYATYDDVNENNIKPFAFFNGSEWVINNEGNATLQVVDVMGRVLSSETLNGATHVNLNATPGVYMLRLVNGDNVMVQKVVVK